MFCRAGLLLLAALLAHPGVALAQRSAAASATLRFEVLAVHAVLSSATVSSPLDEKMTIAVEPPPQAGLRAPAGKQAHMLVAPGLTLTPLPRGSSIVVTVTD